MSISSTSTSSTNTSYNPTIPFRPVEIPTSDTSPDSHSSQRFTPPSRESSLNATTPPTRGVAPSDDHRPRTSAKTPWMEDKQVGEQKGKEVSRNTSPSGSSQGDMADNEMESGPSTQPAEQSTPAPPPKKKRTRTLTTPHQAAVLHALLAQSRFPTTAMREEVGRQIGLSARKVQIWFQNQRQKARRPRGQNVPPLSRPPQYGAFQNIPSGSTISEAGPSSRAGLSAEGHPQSPPEYQSAPSSAGSDTFSNYRSSFSSEGRPQLSGPGVPGVLPSSPPSPRAIRSAPYPRVGIRSLSPTRLQLIRPVTAEERVRIPRARALSPQPRQSIDSALAALTLPPLTFDRPRSYTVTGAGPSGSYRNTPQPPVFTPPMTSVLPPLDTQGLSRPNIALPQAGSPFAYHAPLRIPPPFTLQPRPQWDDASFSPFHRPSHNRNLPTRLPHESLTLPPAVLPHDREGTTLSLPPPSLTSLPSLPSIPFEAGTTSSITPLSDPSRSMTTRRRRYDEDDAQSHDQDSAL